MDDNPEDPLKEKIKHCQEIARYLKEEFQSLLQKPKSTDTTADSDHSVKQTPLSKDVTKQLMDIDLALESIQQQFKLTLDKYLNTQSDLPASKDRPMIQSNNNQMLVAKILINQQINLSKDSNGQNEANLNPTVQALFTGTLPNDFYLHLISVMGIQECLLSNRLVCSFWNELVLERCSNQKSLKLFESFDRLVIYGELLLEFGKSDDTSVILKSIGDELLFEGLEIDHDQLVKRLYQKDNEEGDIPKEVMTGKKKLEASKVLTSLFPSIEELVLIPEEDTLINIEHLLQFYAGQLTSLTMTYFGTWNEDPSSKLRAFTFPNLKTLTTFWFSPQDAQLLTLLPQLESLTMESTTISLETLLRTGSLLGELNIEHIGSVYTAPEEELSKRPLINNNLRNLSLGYAKYFLQALEFVSLNFTSLECLKLDLRCNQDDCPHLHLLSPYLLSLTQLHSLTLEAPVSFFLLDDNQLAKIKPLPSVRQLKLLLWNYASLPRESMDLFSRSLFTAFPKVEQVLVGFVGIEHEDEDDFVDEARVDADTLDAFEAFAGKHLNVVQLFRTKSMSKFTNLPNIVSPLLGQHRQVYEEYIQEEELFGVAICKLTACLVTPEGEVRPNLKRALRPADRLTAMSNLFQLLESGAFALTYEKASAMIWRMVKCALKYGPSQGTLFSVTCNCVLFLLDCSVVKEVCDSDKDGDEVYWFFKMMLKLVEHYRTKQVDDKSVLLQLCKRIVRTLTVYKFDSFNFIFKFNANEVFKICLKLADYYKTEQLNDLDNKKEFLLQIRNLMDNQLKKLDNEGLDAVMSKFIRSENRVYRVETARALTRCCKSADNCFK